MQTIAGLLHAQATEELQLDQLRFLRIDFLQLTQGIVYSIKLWSSRPSVISFKSISARCRLPERLLANLRRALSMRICRMARAAAAKK